MNFMKLLFGDAFHTQNTSLPGWRNRRHLRPQKRSGGRGEGRAQASVPNRMQIERFTRKETRDERFQELRRRENPPEGLAKFSTVEGRTDVWCITFR